MLTELSKGGSKVLRRVYRVRRPAGWGRGTHTELQYLMVATGSKRKDVFRCFQSYSESRARSAQW